MTCPNGLCAREFVVRPTCYRTVSLPARGVRIGHAELKTNAAECGRARSTRSSEQGAPFPNFQFAALLTEHRAFVPHAACMSLCVYMELLHAPPCVCVQVATECRGLTSVSPWLKVQNQHTPSLLARRPSPPWIWQRRGHWQRVAKRCRIREKER